MLLEDAGRLIAFRQISDEACRKLIIAKSVFVFLGLKLIKMGLDGFYRRCCYGG